VPLQFTDGVLVRACVSCTTPAGNDMNAVTFALFIAALAPAAEPRPARPEELALTITPHVSHDPGTIRVRVHIEPHDANRSVTLTLDAADYYASSTVQLDGTAGPALVVRQFHELPPGVYGIEARVQRNDGTVIIRRDEATVVGPPRWSVPRVNRQSAGSAPGMQWP
jgi:hypothetical protein